MQRKLGLAIALVLGFAAVVRAAPLDLKQVDADAKWLVHVDADAMRTSSVIKQAHEQMLKQHPEAEKHLAKIREELKFDPCADIHGVTLYGEQFKKDTGVAIVYAKVNQTVLLEKAKQAPDHRVSTYGKHELHTWTHAKGGTHQRSMTGTFYKLDVLIFGGSPVEVMAALDVLDGTKPSLAGKPSPLAGNVPAGASFVARAVGLSTADLPCKSPVAKQVESLSLAVGENKGESFFAGTLAVKQAEVAQQIKAAVEGARAIAALAHGNNPEALKLINAVKVTASDKTVTVEWRAPADAVWTHLQKAWAKMHKDGHPFPFGPRKPAEEKK